MSNSEFISKLNDCIKFVFAHEQEFVFEFLREFAGCEVEAFYMAVEQCSVNLIDMETGGHYLTTIETDDFISWYEKING